MSSSPDQDRGALGRVLSRVWRDVQQDLASAQDFHSGQDAQEDGQLLGTTMGLFIAPSLAV